jgi:hypothetical protein
LKSCEHLIFNSVKFLANNVHTTIIMYMRYGSVVLAGGGGQRIKVNIQLINERGKRRKWKRKWLEEKGRARRREKGGKREGKRKLGGKR